MVHICPERYPKHVVKKLYARTIRPYPIFRRHESNAYLINLPLYMSISLVFNAADFFLLPMHIRASIFVFFCFCMYVFHFGFSCSFYCFRTAR